MFAMGSSSPDRVAPRADRCLGGQLDLVFLVWRARAGLSRLDWSLGGYTEGANAIFEMHNSARRLIEDHLSVINARLFHLTCNISAFHENPDGYIFITHVIDEIFWQLETKSRVPEQKRGGGGGGMDSCGRCEAVSTATCAASAVSGMGT